MLVHKAGFNQCLVRSLKILAMHVRLENLPTGQALLAETAKTGSLTKIWTRELRAESATKFLALIVRGKLLLQSQGGS